jgi:hypothetical protein
MYADEGRGMNGRGIQRRGAKGQRRKGSTAKHLKHAILETKNFLQKATKLTKGNQDLNRSKLRTQRRNYLTTKGAKQIESGE